MYSIVSMAFLSNSKEKKVRFNILVIFWSNSQKITSIFVSEEISKTLIHIPLARS